MRPNEIAMAVPNRRSRSALPSAAQRSRTPRINATPRTSSATVAAQARNEMVDAGMNEFTSRV